MQQNVYSGDYVDNWRELSTGVKEAAGWRCVRCQHPFASPAMVTEGAQQVLLVPQGVSPGGPLFCDSRCDSERGIHRRVQLDSVAVRRIGPTNAQWLGSLSLTVHHFDGDKSNNRWWNLMCLCNSCHLKIQSSVIPQRAWLFEHSDWAKPYVAGFYAHWFARVEPRREVVESALPIFLALGQPWLYPEHAPAAQAWIAAAAIEDDATRVLRTYRNSFPG
jgi:hypothetical protein